MQGINEHPKSAGLATPAVSVPRATFEERQKLRGAALRASKDTLSQPWELQTSCSFRRLGALYDGDVLRAVVARYDRHPDLLAASGVLDYIVAAQPRAVLALLRALDGVEEALNQAKITGATQIPSMAHEERQKLRDAALRAGTHTLTRPWELQTSNSFRRIGTDRGDGDVLCAVTQRSDGRPDLHAAPDVLNYIVAAQPRAVLALLRALDEAEEALNQAQITAEKQRSKWGEITL